MYVCIHVCMRVHVNTFVYVSIHSCKYECIHVCMNAFMYVNLSHPHSFRLGSQPITDSSVTSGRSCKGVILKTGLGRHVPLASSWEGRGRGSRCPPGGCCPLPAALDSSSGSSVTKQQCHNRGCHKVCNETIVSQQRVSQSM